MGRSDPALLVGAQQLNVEHSLSLLPPRPRVREQSLAVIRAGRAMPSVLLGQSNSAPGFDHKFESWVKAEHRTKAVGLRRRRGVIGSLCVTLVTSPQTLSAAPRCSRRRPAPHVNGTTRRTNLRWLLRARARVWVSVCVRASALQA